MQPIVTDSPVYPCRKNAYGKSTRYTNCDRYRRADRQGRVDRDMVDELSQQQVTREERRGEKEIIHGVQVDAAQAGHDENHKKEK